MRPKNIPQFYTIFMAVNVLTTKYAVFILLGVLLISIAAVCVRLGSSGRNRRQKRVKYYEVKGRLICVQEVGKVRSSGSGSRSRSVEGFDTATATTTATTPQASTAAPTSSVTAAPTTAATPPTTTASVPSAPVNPPGVVSGTSPLLGPSGGVGVPPPPPSPQGPVATAVATPPQPTCTPSDRKSFMTQEKQRLCKMSDRRSFAPAGTVRCGKLERAKFDVDSPAHMRMELEQLELRRSEIAAKLGVNLNASGGYRVGCVSDGDCNQFPSYSLTGAKNVCKVDNSCYCSDTNTSGPFCQYPTRYKDTASMTAEERDRFKNMDDLSDFTVRDYFNWLLTYKNDPRQLSDDHYTNYLKIMQGDTIPKASIPLKRISPPLPTKEYLKLLSDSTAIPVKGVGIEDPGPYVGYNYYAFGEYTSPEEGANLRVMSSDSLQKVEAKELDAQFGLSDRKT